MSIIEKLREMKAHLYNVKATTYISMSNHQGMVNISDNMDSIKGRIDQIKTVMGLLSLRQYLLGFRACISGYAVLSLHVVSQVKGQLCSMSPGTGLHTKEMCTFSN